MKNRKPLAVVSLLMVLLCLLMFSSCQSRLSTSGYGSTSSTSTYSASSASSTSLDQSDPKHASVEANEEELLPEQSVPKTPNEDEIVYTEVYSLVQDNVHDLRSLGFSGDLAWTMLRNDETNEVVMGLINARGNVVYLANAKDNLARPTMIAVTPFINNIMVPEIQTTVEKKSVSMV